MYGLNGEGVPFARFVSRTVKVVGARVCVVELQVGCPRRFEARSGARPLSPLCLTSGAALVGVVRVMDNLFLSGSVICRGNGPTCLISLTGTFR